jgi:16S rRNA processing protein RimM
MAFDELVVIGSLGAPHGVRGWIKVNSAMQPPEALLEFGSWLLADGEDAWTEVDVKSSRSAGRSLTVLLDGLDDRDSAASLTGLEIALPRSVLPTPEADEYYWQDLIGLQVVNLDGVEFGVVTTLMETGANDVLVVKGAYERLVPFVLKEIVKTVDLDSKVIRVDWHPDD